MSQDYGERVEKYKERNAESANAHRSGDRDEGKAPGRFTSANADSRLKKGFERHAEQRRRQEAGVPLDGPTLSIRTMRRAARSRLRARTVGRARLKGMAVGSEEKRVPDQLAGPRPKI